MKISDYIKETFLKRAKEKKCLVIYDPDKRYKDIFLSLKSSQNITIDASESVILSREKALTRWLSLKNNKQLLIYLPYRKPVKDSDKRMNPFEIFAIGGSVFPDGDGDSYKSICLQVYPDNAEQIEELFKSGIPGLNAVDSLKGDIRWPILKTNLNAESSKDIILSIMCPTEEELQFFINDNTWYKEYNDLCKEALGFIPACKNDFNRLQDELWRYILLSEFFFASKVDIPAAFVDIVIAPVRLKEKIYYICDILRNTKWYTDTYIEKAKNIETMYDLPEKISTPIDSGNRDTFLFQTQQPIHKLFQLARDRKYEQLHDIISRKMDSIWCSHDPEAGNLWQIACIGKELLKKIEDAAGRLKTKHTLTQLTGFYATDSFFIDTLSRDFEYRLQSISWQQQSLLEDYIHFVREKNINYINKQQLLFVELVRKEGWYPPGIHRCRDFFTTFIKKHLAYRRTVIFMVDALRYELACIIEKRFSEKHKTNIDIALSTLPSITQLGMAALLPGADEKYKVSIEDKKLVPYINDNKILTPTDRINYLKSIYGDRCMLIDVSDLTAAKKVKINSTIDLLVVKSIDIDMAGEKLSRSANLLLPDLVQHLTKGIEQAIHAGFERIIIAADHGFILFPFTEPGTTKEKTEGDWDVAGKRYLIGRGQIDKNLFRLPKNLTGIDIDADDVVFPKNFCTFRKGIFIHGGVSLQECVIPVITIEALKHKYKKSQIEIILTYKGKSTGKITTRLPIITISIPEEKELFEDIITEVELMVLAFSGKNIVGEPALNQYIDPSSGIIKINKGSSAKIPLKMNDEFEGKFEVKISNPVTGERYASMELETNYLE